MNKAQKLMRRAFKRRGEYVVAAWQGTCAYEGKVVRGRVPGQTHTRCKQQCRSCVVWYGKD